MRRYRRQDVEAAAQWRAGGYLEDVLSVAQEDGEHLTLSEEDYQRLKVKYAAPQLPRDWPAFSKLIARRRAPTDSGIGDTIARVIGPVGGDAYKSWFARLFGKPCGCLERQEELNRRFPYGGNYEV